MKYLILVGVVLVVAVGAAGLVLGEADDSPGLQGIGGILVIAALVVGFRTLRRPRRG